MRSWFQRSLLVVVLFSLMATALPHRSTAQPTNKQLTIGIIQEFDALNILISQSAVYYYIYGFLGRTLTSMNADWQWACWLCTEFPTFKNGLVKIIEEKGQKKLEVRWQIKAGAKWGDGTPVTGHDFKLAWEIGKSPNVVVPEKDIYEQIERVIIDPKNPKKFITIYKEPRFNYYHLGTFYLLPHHIEAPIWQKTKESPGAYEKQSAYATQPTNPGLYHGPYRLTEVKFGSHVVLKRNPHFYGNKPKIEKIIFKVIPNTQTLEANLFSGTIDMIAEIGLGFDIGQAIEKRIQKDPKLKKRFVVQYRQGMIYEHIDLNLRNPILKDLRMRRALVHAVDRDKMVKALFAGKHAKALHTIHPLDPNYTDDVTTYPYDPKKAAQLLEEAGWKMGKQGIREKDGKPLSLTIMTTAGHKSREIVQVFLQNEWKKVGIDVSIKNEPARVFFNETVRKANFPHMIMYAWMMSPESIPTSTLRSSEIPTKENGYSGQNYGGYVSAASDAALDGVLAEFNFDKRKELMKIVQQEYSNNVPVIPLYFRVAVGVAPTNLRGYRITGHQFMSPFSSENWYLK